MSRKSQLKQLKQYLEQNIKERTTPEPTAEDQPQNTATGTRARGAATTDSWRRHHHHRHHHHTRGGPTRASTRP